jgi:hypothetical protein
MPTFHCFCVIQEKHLHLCHPKNTDCPRSCSDLFTMANGSFQTLAFCSYQLANRLWSLFHSFFNSHFQSISKSFWFYFLNISQIHLLLSFLAIFCWFNHSSNFLLDLFTALKNNPLHSSARLLYQKWKLKPGVVAHACNSSYSEGGNLENHGSRPVRAKSSRNQERIKNGDWDADALLN